MKNCAGRDAEIVDQMGTLLIKAIDLTGVILDSAEEEIRKARSLLDDCSRSVLEIMGEVEEREREEAIR